MGIVLLDDLIISIIIIYRWTRKSVLERSTQPKNVSGSARICFRVFPPTNRLVSSQSIQYSQEEVTTVYHIDDLYSMITRSPANCTSHSHGYPFLALDSGVSSTRIPSQNFWKLSIPNTNGNRGCLIPDFAIGATKGITGIIPQAV